ncbi:MAG: SAM-dependent methyltransferase [Acidimicrobiia bacterium]|nr:SAM-dependent methyltransferase [Acidimicrobiia bacterium]
MTRFRRWPPKCSPPRERQGPRQRKGATRSSTSGARSVKPVTSSSTSSAASTHPVTSEHERSNRDFWDADADNYQVVHGDQLARGQVWGVWGIPEADVGALGKVAGLDVLEYGCGAAAWAIALEAEGARVVALDQSRGQLRHAARNAVTACASVSLLCAAGESVPLRDESFDLVFCDHGAMSFCDPARSVPEIARVLRSGGRLVFNKATLLYYLCWNSTKRKQSRRLQSPYFDQRVFDFDEGTTDFQLPYGDWIRLFAAHGLVVVDLVELRPPVDASTTYTEFVPYEWARNWPAEEIWSVRKR